jgi:hypothetical protein
MPAQIDLALGLMIQQAYCSILFQRASIAGKVWSCQISKV